MPETSPRWSRLLHQADDPLFVLNARRRLLYVNPAWERWTDLLLKDVRGRACRPSDDDHGSLFASLTPTKEAIAGEWSHVRRRDATGKSPWIDVHFLPWMKDGKVLAILGRVESVRSSPAAKATTLPEAIVQLRDRRTYRLELWESDVPAVRTAVLQARLAAATTAPVLLQGPPGSGKEWLARTIHRLSPRREEFFACFDAAILPQSMLTDLLLQPAPRLNLGAILLRNPGRLRPEMQTRLAELLAADKLGPRLFVSADATKLLPELLASINALTIVLPPLRERRGDWSRFLPDVLARAAAVVKKPHVSLAPDADQALRLHSWPENFRELDRTIRDAALHAAGERIELADLPFEFRSEPPPREPMLPLDDLLEKAERRLIQLALEQARHNKSKAAELLGIPRARLLRRLEQFGIGAPGDKPEGGDDA